MFTFYKDTICFVYSKNKEGMRTAGLRFSSPKNMVFIAGFFGQLIVKLMNALKVSVGFNIILCFLRLNKLFRENIIQFNSNGAVLQCPGLFHGELIIAMEAGSQSIIFAIQASNPDLRVISKVFNKLVSSRFRQCMVVVPPLITYSCVLDTGIAPDDLCSTCIKLCFYVSTNEKDHIPIEKLGSYAIKSQGTIINWYL